MRCIREKEGVPTGKWDVSEKKKEYQQENEVYQKKMESINGKWQRIYKKIKDYLLALIDT